MEQDSLKSSRNGAKTNGQKEIEVPEEHRQFLAEVQYVLNYFKK